MYFSTRSSLTGRKEASHPFRYAVTFIAVILIDQEGSVTIGSFSSPLPSCSFSTTISVYIVFNMNMIFSDIWYRSALFTSVNIYIYTYINGLENRLDSCVKKICILSGKWVLVYIMHLRGFISRINHWQFHDVHYSFAACSKLNRNVNRFSHLLILSFYCHLLLLIFVNVNGLILYNE